MEAMDCQLNSESNSQGPGSSSNKSCSSTTTVDNLPSDVILNILLRQPAKSVLRSRSVSKTWLNILDKMLITNMPMPNYDAVVEEPPDLVLLSYPTRFRRRSCPIGWQDKTRFFSLKYDGNIFRAAESPIAEFTNAHHCFLSAINLGILIFRNSRHKGESFLLNPCRAEVLRLPPATVPASPHRTVLEHYGFGFDGTTNTYKVVRIFTCNEELDPKDYVAEVYTLGTESWRRIYSVFPYHVDVMPISAYGDIHWMIYGAIPEGSAESMIISFDFKREEFKLTPHPDFRCKNYNYFRLVDLRGSLAILDLSPTTQMEIWVLKDYGRNEWAQEYTISIELWRREEQLHFQVPDFRPGTLRVVGAWEEGLLFEVAMGYRFFYYNLKTGSLRYITCISPTNAASDTLRFPDNSWIYSYTGSLVSLRNHGNLMAKEVGAGNCFDLTAAGVDSVLHSVKI